MGMKISQNLLLSRILTYMNGTLFNDSYFKIVPKQPFMFMIIILLTERIRLPGKQVRLSVMKGSRGKAMWSAGCSRR